MERELTWWDGEVGVPCPIAHPREHFAWSQKIKVDMFESAITAMATPEGQAAFHDTLLTVLKMTGRDK